jgi:hypothetical protein
MAYCRQSLVLLILLIDPLLKCYRSEASVDMFGGAPLLDNLSADS